ncbi:MAG TPA: riboflavin synthase [Nitrososphaeraceae archaeon]|jgi:riboflavin synthase
MFTGIVKGTGIVKSISRDLIGNFDSRVTVDLGSLAHGLKIGDSVCINGACLTVTELKKSVASFELVKETIDKTTFGLMKRGDKVNLERSLMTKDRLEGHIVLGHIDDIGKIAEIVNLSKGTIIWIKITNPEMMKFIVPKGSITIDGISLTVVNVRKSEFSIALVPHTLLKTSIATKLKGDFVNIECDILGKYVANLLPKKK